MRVAIDISYLGKSNLASHKVRGAGRYSDELFKSLQELDKKNEYELIRQKKPLSGFDIIHYPYFEPFFLSLPMNVSMPSIVTVHDLIPLIFPDKFPIGIKGAVRWKIQKKSLKNKSIIVTDSESSKRDISKIAGISSDKIEVVYLAASDVYKKSPMNKSILKRLNLPEDFFLYVGDATWNKNLVRIAKATKQSRINLVMVGKTLANDNFDSNNYWNRELASFKEETRNDKTFFFTEFVNDRDLNDLYNLASGLLMPSCYEGFGLPVLEAMQAGCPVITSDKGSLREVGGDAVFYVDPYDVDSIANGINTLSGNNKLKNELSKKGMNQAKKFSWEKVVKEMKQIYEELI